MLGKYSRTVVPIALAVALLAGTAGVRAGPGADSLEPAGAVVPQPDTVDNLQHRPGTRTAPLGTLGHVERRGTGPVPVILIPGASFGWEIWEAFMERNADRYTMWAITPPGYDGTDPPPMPPADDFTNRVWSDAVVGAIAELIDREDLVRPVVVGHHLMGDYYALRVGLELGDRVGGVAILAGGAARPVPPNLRADPTQPATTEERIRWVHETRVPFFQTVTDSVWRNGTYAADALSHDPDVGRDLFERQISTPLPIQIRYFLEYLTDDLRPRLAEMKPPVLALFAAMDVDDVVSENRDALVQRFGSVEAAKDSLLARFGGEEAFINARNPWAGMEAPPPNVTTVPVEETGIFMMHDQAELVDRNLSAWVARVRP